MNEPISLNFHQAQAVAERAAHVRSMALRHRGHRYTESTRVIVTLGNPYYSEPKPENHGYYLTIEGKGNAPVPLFAKDLGQPRTFDPARLPARDQDGHMQHPDMDGIGWDEFDVGPQLRALGWLSKTVSFESDATSEQRQRYSESDCPSCLHWTPTPPLGNGWLMAAIYDTENGPVALFVRDADDLMEPREGRGNAGDALRAIVDWAEDEGQAAAPAWADAERIRDLPAVDEALLNFKDDCTGDNATCIVRAVLDAAGAPQPEVERLRAEQAASVMPQIGPLLDAWDGMDNDTKAGLKEDAPDLANALAAISRAMDGTDGVGTVDGGRQG